MKNYQFYRIVLIIVIVFGSAQLKAQLMNHYWSQSYNSISSLLSGAVVGGDAGNAAIYYNPANIVEIEKGSNVSLAASFLTFNYYAFNNALGEGNDVSASNFYVQPQFFSIGINSPFNNVSFEIAVFNRVKEQLNLDYVNSEEIQLIESGGDFERLTTQYNYKNNYTDDWIGIGAAYSINNNFHLGISLNASISTLHYSNYISARINSSGLDNSNIEISSLLAKNEYHERVDFTNVRLIVRMGSSYETGNWKFGLNLSLPPLNVITVSDKALRSQEEIYYNSDDAELNFSDKFIFNAQGEDLKNANYKLPFSIALGTVYKFGLNKKFYSTVEYFNGLKPYKMIDAPLNPEITTDPIYEQMENKDWLSFAYGARNIINVAIGYRWQIKPKVLFLMGLRTDFNNVKGFDYKDYEKYARVKTSEVNIYHATGGVQFAFRRHRLIAGTQLSYGMERGKKQIANFGSDYEPDYGNELPMFGVRENTVDVYYFSISVFLGATLNFESKKQFPEE